MPKQARWEFLQKNAKQVTIGKLIDDAMVLIEKENPQLRGVLSKDYARPALDKQRLGELIDLIGTIGLGGEEHRSKDILGRVYEYFLGQFASAEGKKGGEFYTPRCVVRLLVEMIEKPLSSTDRRLASGASPEFFASRPRPGELAIGDCPQSPLSFRNCRTTSFTSRCSPSTA